MHIYAHRHVCVCVCVCVCIHIHIQSRLSKIKHIDFQFLVNGYAALSY